MKTHSRVFVLLMLLGVVLHVRCRPSGQERISYGTKVPKGSMKYFVTLSINQGNGLFDCGGSLISPTVVVTAAHCLYSDNGELTSESIQISGNKAIAIGATKPKLYNPFQNGDFTGDIALVKFDTAVGRDVVRLAPRGTKLENTEVLVAGKGQTEQEQFSKDLRYIIVPTMSKSEILNLYETDVETDGEYSMPDEYNVEVYGLWDEYSTDLDLRMPEKRLRGKKKGKEKKDAMYKNRAYEDDHFGAGDRKADSCRGDSGGPAIWPSKSSWGKWGRKEVKEDVLVGIVSYGPAIYRCGDKGSFGLYTDVGYWEEWINKTMDEDEFEKLT
jgi:secreted trypsin-like serine protease